MPEVTTGGPRTAAEPVTPRAAGRAGPGRSRRYWFDNHGLPVVLVAPALLLVVGLVGYPVLRTFWLSFFDAGLPALVSGEMDFVGLDNYREVVTDPHLRRVFATTAVFGLLCVAGTMTVGVAVALLLARPFRGRVVLGVIVLLPWAMPRIAAATVWQWLFHDQYGIINWALAGIGLTSFDGYSWFTSRGSAFVAIGIVVIWQSFPFVALAVLAALQSIPDDVLEAARLDGAGPWQITRHVRLPMIRSVLLVMVVISTIWDFKIFDQVFAMTGGGPARSTELLAITTWREAFTQLNFGMASALAMAMFAILTVITIAYIRLLREDEGLAR